MPKFGRKSKERLNTCESNLQKVFNEVIKHVDCSVLEGHREKDRQNKLFEEGKTKVKYPNGRHNRQPSSAVDVRPILLTGVTEKGKHCLLGLLLVLLVRWV